MTTTQDISKRAKARFNFFKEIYNELKKVVWLSRREVTYLTGLVLIVSIAAGILLGAIDYGLSALVDTLLIGG